MRALAVLGARAELGELGCLAPQRPHPFSSIDCPWASIALAMGSFSLEEIGSATPILLSSHSPHSAADSKGPLSTTPHSKSGVFLAGVPWR